MFGFESEPGWEEHVGRVGIEVMCRRLQPVLDHLREEYAGHPADEIKPVLAREWEACTGGPIADPDLTRYAAVISRGRRIVLEPQP
ncbi:hypothetical protein HC031_04725 [Planosporangium thailandense]|uniref:Uncharacterized protein n=1 Tax=Planosporangium thailandense TaxID=765197 RepID=A0ABX0XSQ5_9ACTN|nr:hypothetical protein [Planosporangium thailandense]NJC69030.1 hypothetical protein [Planosporangium thailandense]